jgi:hypothetical protein
MKTKEEAKIWEALELLTAAEYAIEAIAAKAKDVEVYRNFEKAREKIKEADALITPLRGRDD